MAFDAISWRFYFVFIACNAFAGLAYYFYLPETRFLTLEEVAAKFGDEVVSPMHKDLISDDMVETEEKKNVVHVEAERKA
jgi:hypothetical protein